MKEKITELLKAAMKEKDTLKVSVYRSLKADIETAEKNGQVDTMAIIAKAAKKRSDALDQYVQANRHDLAGVEGEELIIISELLPKQPTKDEIKHCIKLNAELHGNHMGNIIKNVKAKYPTTDGKALANMVKEFLNGNK